MKCHTCQKKTKVEETRVLPENPRWTKRRRVCKNCGFTLWTIEMPAEDVVVKEYPKKVAKGEARKAWIQTEKIRPDLETLLKAVKTAKRLEEWRKDGGKFVPYPATWLRAERWEDEYELDIEDAVEVNGKVVNWWESATGIETRGREVGMTPEQFASWPEFKAAVLRQLMRAA